MQNPATVMSYFLTSHVYHDTVHLSANVKLGVFSGIIWAGDPPKGEGLDTRQAWLAYVANKFYFAVTDSAVVPLSTHVCPQSVYHVLCYPVSASITSMNVTLDYHRASGCNVSLFLSTTLR